MRSAVVLLCSVLCAACAWSGTRISESALARFKPGVTTEADVIKALGPPEVRTLASDGTRSIQYVYSRSRATAASYLPFIGMFAGGTRVQTRAVTFQFDAGGKLLRYIASAASSDVHRETGKPAQGG